MLATREVLLLDEALMGMVGFNGAQVRQGSNDRGLSRRALPGESRGPCSFETVADTIATIGSGPLAVMFNGVIRCLATQGVCPKQIEFVLEAIEQVVAEGALWTANAVWTAPLRPLTGLDVDHGHSSSQGADRA